MTFVSPLLALCSQGRVKLQWEARASTKPQSTDEGDKGHEV